MYTDILGWVGTGSVLLAYFSVSTKKIKPNTLLYQGLNAFGSIGLIIHTFAEGASAALVLNIIWLCIALFSLIQSRRP